MAYRKTTEYFNFKYGYYWYNLYVRLFNDSAE